MSPKQLRNTWAILAATACSLLLTVTCSHALSDTERVLELVNAERVKAGVRPVTMNDQLTASAGKYALYLGQARFFGHIGPDGSTVVSRNVGAGYCDAMWLGENIAGGFSSPGEVLAAWMESLPHRSNLLDPNFAEIGIASVFVPGSPYGRYWVQEFGVKSDDYSPYDPRERPVKLGRRLAPSSSANGSSDRGKGVVSSGGSSGRTGLPARETAAKSAPVVSAVDPAVGQHGTVVRITGHGFGKSGTLRFGGLTAKVSSWSDKLIVATVPEGAISAGLTVANEAGVISMGVGFRIASASPALTSAQKASTTASR